MTRVLGRGTWLDTAAARIVEREKALGRKMDIVRVESGLGASGIPHVGSVGDAVRAHGVRLALEDLGYRSELIAFSDDLDGLRKVPSGLPDRLHQHIGVPVSMIPDPFDCHESYGGHMSSILLDALDRLGIEYRFQSGVEAYSSGLLTQQVALILENADAVGRLIAEMLGQKKFEEILPYYPVCEGCGRIYLAEAYHYDAKTMKVSYRCRGSEIGRRWVQGCGHEGEVSIEEGRGKLSWKGEFAARWAALGIRFEAYGKDIADSVRVNDRVSAEILGYPPPYHVRYELFLDKSGRKISKSLGNVFTPQLWLQYGTPVSLLLLMYKRIAGTRYLSVEDIPNYMDEYDRLEDLYFSRVEEPNPAKRRKLKGLYEYVNHLKPPSQPDVHVPYRMLVQLTSVAPKDDPVSFVVKRLKTYGWVKDAPPSLIKKVELARNWAEDFRAPSRPQVSLSEAEKGAVRELVEALRRERDPARIQGEIFEAARRHGIAPPEFFKTLYLMILGSLQGPRLGPYLADIGVTEAAELLSAFLEY